MGHLGHSVTMFSSPMPLKKGNLMKERDRELHQLNELIIRRRRKTASHSFYFFLSSFDDDGVDFTNMNTLSFYVRRSQKCKITVKSSVSFCAFRICAWKKLHKTLVKLTLGDDGAQKEKLTTLAPRPNTSTTCCSQRLPIRPTFGT